MSTFSIREADPKRERLGFSHPLFFFATFLLCTVALNAEWSDHRLVWWGSVAFFVCAWFFTSGLKIYVDPTYTVWLLSFLSFAALSYFWAESSDHVVNILKSLVVRLVILLLIRSAIRSKGDLHKLLVCVAGAAVVNSFYLLINSFEELTADTDSEIGNRLGTDGDWNANAIGMLVAIAALLFLYFYQKNTKPVKKITCVLLVAAMIVIALLTGSRKAFIIVLGGTIGYLLLTNKGKRFRTLLFAAAFVWVLFYIAMETEFFYSIIGNRIDGFLSLITGKGEADSSSTLREKLIAGAIEVWKEYPDVGCGLGCYQLFSVGFAGREMYAHNNYVELLADLGIVGTMIYYSGPMLLLVSLLRKLKNKENEGRLFLTLIVVILVLDFACVSYTDFLFSLVYMAAFSYISMKSKKEKEE